MVSLRQGNIFKSIQDQKPNPYWKFDDPYPQYIQLQRTPATISGQNIRFNVNAFDPNTFLRSKAYVKVTVRIDKQERTAAGVIVASNYVTTDRIYKKPGLVLQNSCDEARLTLNSHSMVYNNLRYITKKLNMSFAGEKINNNYFSTSGSSYENLNGVYNELGDIIPSAAIQNPAVLQGVNVFGFDTVIGPNRVEYTQASGTMTFDVNGGNAIDLITIQRFTVGDVLSLATGERFSINLVLTALTLNADRIDAAGDVGPQDLTNGDLIRQNLLIYKGYSADSGRQDAYENAFRDINVGATSSTFNFTEPLSFGCFNHLADYEHGEIYSGSWNLKQSPLIPYIRELQLSMNLRNIAANSLIYAYGRNNTAATTNSVQLIDSEITQAELVLIWVKPRDELLRNMPTSVKIQSWQYQHEQFDLGVVNNGANVVSAQNNIYTNQVPSYLMYYGMVDKDSGSYICRAVNTDTNGLGGRQVTSLDINSVESGMHPLAVGTGSNFILRSNTLGGDDILDRNYNNKELYRLTLKNSISDFPYNETRFRGIPVVNSLLATYPSQFYILLGEQDLNSFFIRKGQLQTSNVINYNSTLVASDGHSISKDVQAGVFNGGNKNYALHIFYIYDRYYIELNNEGFVDSKFDSQFY